MRYDIRTNLCLPNAAKTETIKILVGVEAQKEDKPGYDIPLRALFYCSRMISAQLGTEFSNQADDPVKYGNIKKVYSIFICSDTAEARANSVDRYTINRDTIIGENQDQPRYDIMSAVIINIGNKHDAKETDSRMLKMLNNLLNEEMSTAQKMTALKACGIKVTREIETEVDDMCTYTANVLQRGREEGRAEIIEKMLTAGKTPEEIAAFTGISIEEINEVEASKCVSV